MTRPSVSVAMATYNGEKFVLTQIQSIISQLALNDQLVISDNGSTDQTVKIIDENYHHDSRVELIFCQEKGVIANFSYALSHCRNEIIFLSDQDDVWLPNKVDVFLEHFSKQPEIDLFMSDITVVDNQLEVMIPSFFAYRNTGLGVGKNILKNTFIGCAMAFRKSFISPLLPIPRKVPMHDMWFGILANKHHKAALISEKLVLYRRHEDTVTTVENQSSLREKLLWRFRIIYFVFFYRVKTN